MATSVLLDDVSDDSRNLKKIIAQVKYVQLDREVLLGERAGYQPTPLSSDETRALGLMHTHLRAMAKMFLAQNPGGSIAQFVYALQHGRAPSAGLTDDTNPTLQRELAQIIAVDPSFLDF